MDTLLSNGRIRQDMRCVHCNRSFRVDSLERYEREKGNREYIRTNGRGSQVLCRRSTYEYICWINTFINGRRLPSCVELLSWGVKKEDLKMILRGLGAEIND